MDVRGRGVAIRVAFFSLHNLLEISAYTLAKDAHRKNITASGMSNAIWLAAILALFTESLNSLCNT